MSDSTDLPPVEPLPDVPPVPYVADNLPRVDPYGPPPPVAAPVAPPVFPTAAPAYPAAPPAGVAGPTAGPATPPPYGYSQQGYPYATGYQPVAPTGLSVTSMVLGIVGVVGSLVYGLGLFPSIGALITGLMARKRQPHAKAFWLTGIITGSVGIGIAVLWIIGIIALIIFAGSVGSDNGFSVSNS